MRGLKFLSPPYSFDLLPGRTLRGCVDWNREAKKSTEKLKVAPFAGAWIEIVIKNINIFRPVLSHPSRVRGLKFKILRHQKLKSCSRTLRGCVDWNLASSKSITGPNRSHPSRVRGLKFICCTKALGRLLSHPSRVRGLKYQHGRVCRWSCYCRTLRGCVDWNISNSRLGVLILVAPFAGAWIEIWTKFKELVWFLSHPSRVRGLKSLFCAINYWYGVKSHPSRVRGLKYLLPYLDNLLQGSHPSRVRGLKFKKEVWCGLVTMVAPFAGAWIEIIKWEPNKEDVRCRTLRGCVDWNLMVMLVLFVQSPSHPSRVRGLK